LRHMRARWSFGPLRRAVGDPRLAEAGRTGGRSPKEQLQLQFGLNGLVAPVQARKSWSSIFVDEARECKEGELEANLGFRSLHFIFIGNGWGYCNRCISSSQGGWMLFILSSDRFSKQVIDSAPGAQGARCSARHLGRQPSPVSAEHKPYPVSAHICPNPPGRLRAGDRRGHLARAAQDTGGAGHALTGGRPFESTTGRRHADPALHCTDLKGRHCVPLGVHPQVAGRRYLGRRLGSGH
jgi:hypothetical protein